MTTPSSTPTPIPMTTPGSGQIAVTNVTSEIGLGNSNVSFDTLHNYVIPSQRASYEQMSEWYNKSYFQKNTNGNCNNGNCFTCNCWIPASSATFNCFNCFNCYGLNCANCDGRSWLQSNCNCACSYNCNQQSWGYNCNCNC
jgi:hypothetical protein